MDWHARIEANPAISAGKPVIKGTRLSVHLLMELLAGGWTEAMIFESYPRLTREDMQAVYAYAAECMVSAAGQP